MKRHASRFKILLFTVASALIVSAAVICHLSVPSVISIYYGGDACTSLSAPFTLDDSTYQSSAAEVMAYDERVTSYTTEAYVLGIIPIKSVEVNVYDRVMLCPGGMTIGVRMATEGVLVTGISDIPTHNGTYSPAYSAGIRVHDIITAINGENVNNASDIIAAIENCAGKAVEVVMSREEQVQTISISPVKSLTDGTYRAGFTLKDGATGLGTVTFIDPADGSFAALGHGITDSSMILPFSSGSVGGVVINGIERGKASAPGEISGMFSSERLGVLTDNTHAGIFGYYNELPQNLPEALPIALKDEITNGTATILSTDGGGGVAEYDVVISGIDRSGVSEIKNFVVEVTDPDLLALTGGIIQGMSGSPIIQNQHIVGAVTHVMVNDPTRGYGIFIENMLIHKR